MSRPVAPHGVWLVPDVRKREGTKRKVEYEHVTSETLIEWTCSAARLSLNVKSITCPKITNANANNR